MANVLVIEDDDDIRLLVATALKHEGHGALVAANARAGLQIARTAAVDLVILDLVLPDLAGASVLEQLASDVRTQRLPIIILTARADERDRVHGLELGADDYITKPFSVRELVLRVNVALRRRGGDEPRGVVLHDVLRIDCEGHRVFLDGKELDLTPTEFRLLAKLAGRPDHVQTRQSLLAAVWGVQPDLETRTVDTHIRRLREKLGCAADLIETVRGVGYRFRKLPCTPILADHPVDVAEA
jgi:two-component system phosphate regulon response regulator PhoB